MMADGTAFTDYLSRLNNCTSSDGTDHSFDGSWGYCDWRLPTIQKLKTILDCSFSPCINPVFGATAANSYWSATTYALNPGFAYDVGFGDGILHLDLKGATFGVRAVRAGL